MSSAYVVMLTATFFVIAYFYVKIRLVAVLEPSRLELLVRAKDLLGRADLIEADRRLVNFAINHSYSTRVGWILAAAVFPFSVRNFATGKKSPSLPGARANEKDIHAFVRLFTLCVVCSSPLAAALFGISLVAALIVRVPVQSVQRGVEIVLFRQSNDTGHRKNFAH
ncbi:hypothetical protein [Rhizobium sp. SGZ-381]|uniref:hypothetical protein n=1 Tax=Rhizobium sp. SGZ-381 TaxID=3342800 RepID=UPI00366BAD0F